MWYWFRTWCVKRNSLVQIILIMFNVHYILEFPLSLYLPPSSSFFISYCQHNLCIISMYAIFANTEKTHYFSTPVIASRIILTTKFIPFIYKCTLMHMVEYCCLFIHRLYAACGGHFGKINSYTITINYWTLTMFGVCECAAFTHSSEPKVQ